MEILGQVPTKKPKRISLINTWNTYTGERSEDNRFIFNWEPDHNVENERAGSRLVYQLPQTVVLTCRMSYSSFFVWRSAKLTLTDLDPIDGMEIRFSLGSEGIDELFKAVSEHRVTIDERGRFCGAYTFYNQSGNCFVRPFTGDLATLVPCEYIFPQ